MICISCVEMQFVKHLAIACKGKCRVLCKLVARVRATTGWPGPDASKKDIRRARGSACDVRAMQSTEQSANGHR